MAEYLEYEIRVKTKDSNKFELLYSTTTPLPEYKLIDPVLTLEESASGSLEFKTPPTNIMHGKIGMMTSTIRVYCNKEEIWEGRPLKTDEDMFFNHKIVCEGALSYLNDVYQPQAVYKHTTYPDFLKAVIEIYNAKAPEYRRFDIGYVNTSVSQASIDTEFITNYESTLTTLNNFCSSHGCYMYTERNKYSGRLTINFGDSSTRNHVNDTQTIEFGKNLIEYARNFDFSNMISVILPLGAKIEKDEQKNVRGDLLRPFETTQGGIVIANPIDWEMSDPLLSVEDTNYVVHMYHVNPSDVVYITSQMRNAHGFWVVKDANRNIYYNQVNANNSSNLSVADNRRVEMPDETRISENSILYVGEYKTSNFTGFGVYKGLSNDEIDKLDEYTNVSEYDERDDVKDASGNHVAWVKTEKDSLYVINEEALEEYGWIERKLEFQNETSVPNLYIKARQYLTSDRFDGMQIDITAFDLRALGYDDVDNLKVGQRVNIIAKPYGLNTYMPVTKLRIPLNKPDDMKYSLGSTSSQSLTSVNSSINSDLFSRIASAPSLSTVISSTKKNVVAKIKDCNSSYVTIKYASGTDKAEAIIISDTPNYQQSSKGYWIWNAAGLAFIDGNGDPHNAMTDDGQMYADIITTGTMAADRILGGTLKLGYWNGEDGELRMKDSNGNDILKIDKNTGLQSINPSSDYRAIVEGGAVYFTNPNTGGVDFAPSIANQIFTDSQGNPLYRCLRLYGQRIGFNCENFWVFANGSWYATDSGVRNVTVGDKTLTFVNGILKEVT